MSNPHTTTDIITQRGETLDCALYRSGRKDSRDDILATNKHLAKLPAILPENTRITVPVIQDRNTVKTLKTINLWN